MITSFPSLLLATALIAAGCGDARRESVPTAAGVTAVTLFDSHESSHPSPKDSRWEITNFPLIAKISLSQRAESDPPLPACVPSGTLELVGTPHVTNRFFIVHIHNPAHVYLDGPEGHYVVKNPQELLVGLARAGVPVDKFFADAAGGD
jgi:hypothetical protein